MLFFSYFERHGCRNCILRIQPNSYSRKIYNFMVVVGLYAKSFRFLLTNFRHGCQNCIICIQTNVFGFSKFFLKRERKRPTSFKVNAIGKHRVKNEPIERLIFFPYFNSGRKRMKNFQSFS